MNRLKIFMRSNIITNCKCMIMLCVLSSFLFSLLPRSAGAGENEGKMRDLGKFCVIIRPEIKEVSSAHAAVAGAAQEVLAPVSGRKNGSFFKGSVGKLGFGAPDCFFIDGRVSAESPVAERAIHGPSGSLSEGRGERRGFFPSAGLYSRSARDGRMGFAFGVGLAGSAPSSWEDEGVGTPGAKVSLMLGFGF